MTVGSLNTTPQQEPLRRPVRRVSARWAISPEVAHDSKMVTSYCLKALWEMYQIDASALHSATTILARLITYASSIGPSPPRDSVMEGDTKEITNEMLTKLETILVPLNVPVTKMTVVDARNELRTQSNITFFECAQLLLSISKNLERELKIVKVFALDGAHAAFYEPLAPLFGEDVEKKFPSIAYEIDQAGKCYACDLTTASAFHSIRCLEAGIRAVARCLNIPDPTSGKDRNWSNISRAIKAQIDLKWPASTGRMSGDGETFDGIYGALAGMQNPYRNSTMHLDAKYTAPEALHIYEIVKGVMTKISLRMDENGQPLA